MKAKTSFVQVDVVPLEAIRELSARAEALLSEKLNWEAGIQVGRLTPRLVDLPGTKVDPTACRLIRYIG